MKNTCNLIDNIFSCDVIIKNELVKNATKLHESQLCSNGRRKLAFTLMNS